MRIRRAFSIAVGATGLAVAFLSAAGCGSDVALDKSVQLVDVHSGYADLGIVNGETKLVPSATVRVQNTGASTLSGFQLSASFWLKGGDGEKDELVLPHLVARDLAPGATSDPIAIRANFGYTLEGARADFFAHSKFVDFTIKVFGKVGGRIYKVGEVSVERKILPQDAGAPTK